MVRRRPALRRRSLRSRRRRGRSRRVDVGSDATASDGAAGAARASSAACSSAGRQRQRVEREARPPQPQRRERRDRQPDAHRVELLGARAQHLVDRCRRRRDGPPDRARRRGRRSRRPRRGCARRAGSPRSPVGDELGERGVDLLDAARVEVRGRLVEHEQGRSHRERARDREALASAAGEPVGVLAAPLPQADAAQRRLGAGEHLGHRHPQILGSEGDLVEQRAGDQLCVGVLEDHADARAELGDGGRRRCRRRRPRPCRVTSAGTACGMSPLSASVSVDLPDPLGPSSSTTSPAAMSNETDAGAGVRLAVVRDRELAHPQERERRRTPPRARRQGRARVRSRDFPAASELSRLLT